MPHVGFWPNKSSSTTVATVGFKGVLDGNGHTISYVFSEAGLLGNLLDGAVVKNIGLIATRKTQNSQKMTPSALANTCGAGVILENVYAKISNEVQEVGRNVSLIGTRSNSLQLTSVVVENYTMNDTTILLLP